MKRIEKFVHDNDFNWDQYRNRVSLVLDYPEGMCDEGLREWLLEELLEPQELSTLEFEITKYFIKRGYKWIARDEDDGLCVINNKPYKHIIAWHIHKDGEFVELSEFGNIFSFVKWSDNEPTNLQYLIDNCVIVENK